MLRALAEDLVERMHKDEMSVRVEGSPQDGWILVDLGDVIVHLFSPDRRNYYRLEDLWGKGKVLLRLQ